MKCSRGRPLTAVAAIFVVIAGASFAPAQAAKKPRPDLTARKILKAIKGKNHRALAKQMSACGQREMKELRKARSADLKARMVEFKEELGSGRKIVSVRRASDGWTRWARVEGGQSDAGGEVVVITMRLEGKVFRFLDLIRMPAEDFELGLEYDAEMELAFWYCVDDVVRDRLRRAYAAYETKTFAEAFTAGLRHDQDILGKPLIVQGAQDGKLPWVELALEHGADVNATGGAEKQTALMVAVVGGEEPLVDRLLAASSDVNVLSGTGRTALIYAAELNNESIIKKLVTAGAKPDILERAARGEGALLPAASHGNVNVIKMLLDAKANADRVTDTGVTPLWVAVQAGHFDACKMLIDAGANTQHTAGGVSLIESARSAGHGKIVELLEKSGG